MHKDDLLCVLTNTFWLHAKERY